MVTTPKMTSLSNSDIVILSELKIGDGQFGFTSSIESALEQANLELDSLQETTDSLNSLKPQCDKIDYALAAGSGALCGIIDIFLVGAPDESPLGDISDKWFSEITKTFAKMCGWKGGNDKSAIGFLERKFRVPYDQRGAGDSATPFYVTPSNHHFRSLAHNPSLLGLFFSILDQFTNLSHFIAKDAWGEITLCIIKDAERNFELRGRNIPSKFFCAFVNWIGHLFSDVAGSSGSRYRGAGLPSPFWTWINDIYLLKAKLNIPTTEFENSIYELSGEIFKKGYDVRFQSTQAIPVLINELVVRLLYMIRRLVNFFKDTAEPDRNIKAMWTACNPFGNPTIRRMLTVAHGTFCIIDIGDATVRGFAKGGGAFNPIEFVLRMNIIGVGRFAISLYGEAKDGVRYWHAKKESGFAKREMVVVEDYIEGLKILALVYDDAELKTFIVDLKNGEHIKEAFLKSVRLAELRNVQAPLKTKQDIDAYFNS